MKCPMRNHAASAKGILGLLMMIIGSPEQNESVVCWGERKGVGKRKEQKSGRTMYDRNKNQKDLPDWESNPGLPRLQVFKLTSGNHDH